MKKRILFCIQTMNIGGPQKSLLSLLHEIDYSLYEVSLAIWSGNGELIKYLPKQVHIIEMPIQLSYLRISVEQIKKNSVKLVLNGKIVLVTKIIFLVLFHFFSMTKARQKFWMKNHRNFDYLEGDYDIAIAVSGGNLCYFISDCVKAKRKYTWVRTDYRVLGRDKSIDNYYFNKMDGIITVSKICSDILMKEFPNQEGKIAYFYNILPIKLYNFVTDEERLYAERPKDMIFVTIARLDRNKGFELALQAAQALMLRGRLFTWFFIGDGDYRKEIDNTIKKKSLDKFVKTVGWRFNTLACIKQCDIFIHPSKFEGKSNSVDEAKYACKPIIVTNYPTVSEQVEHMVTGLVVSYDATELADGIEKLAGNKELINMFKTNLSSRISNEKNSIIPFFRIIGEESGTI